MTPLSLLLAAGLGLSLAGCSSEPDCVEYDTAAAERAFSACTSQTGFWNNNTPGRCRDAAKAVSCKRRDGSPLPAAQGGR